MFSGIDLDVYGSTHIGNVRKENEDQFLIAELHKAALVKSTSLTLKEQGELIGSTQGLLLMVADGVRGSAGGKEASAIALRTILDYVNHSMRSFYKSDLQLADDLYRELALSVHLSHEAVVRQSTDDPTRANMATTLTKVHILWPHAYIVQIGDSRCYLIREQKIKLLTKDQTVAEYLVDKGALQPEEANKSQWSNALTQAIGGQAGTLNPSISKQNLRLGDILLLCTDGLTKHLDEHEMLEHLQKTKTSENACASLTEASLTAGGTDNVTAIVCRFNKK